MNDIHVDEVEARLPAGMPENPSRSPVEAQVRELLVKATKESLLLLTDSVTAENAMRVLTQIGKTALAHRKTLTLYGDFQLDEELEGNGGAKHKFGGIPMSNSDAAAFSGLLGGGDRETAAVHMLRELVSSYQQKQRIEQVGSLLTAAEKFRLAGDTERADVFEKKARKLADASMFDKVGVAKPEESVNALLALTGTPDVAELTSLMNTPFSDASGANVWHANLGDAMNGDSGTSPHLGGVEDLEEEDSVELVADDFVASSYNA